VSLVAVVGILVAVVLISLPQLKVHSYITYANAFAVGALLTVSLVHLVPEGLAGLDRYGEGAGSIRLTLILLAMHAYCDCSGAASFTLQSAT
jgi:hypothetical protein